VYNQNVRVSITKLVGSELGYLRTAKIRKKGTKKWRNSFHLYRL